MDSQEKKAFTLTELASSLKSIIEKTYTSSYWVKAEIAKLNHYPRSGHAYPELVEKKNEKIVAQFRGTIWSDDFSRINKSFIEITGEPLKDDVEILFKVKIGFHPVYGLALNIFNIEPSFTLGKMAIEKAKAIEKLKQEGIFNLNKSLDFPLLPRKIAVISVETSKGYNDYMEILKSFSGKYNFFNQLFPAILQGDQAVKTILHQLKAIKEKKHIFDAVSIIRGGGGDIGLNCYNNYELAKEIATFPIPVITGIGHSTNDTVAEMVSYSNKITPTDVAYFFLGKYESYAQRIFNAKQKIISLAQKSASFEQQKVKSLSVYIAQVHSRIMVFENARIEKSKALLKSYSGNFLKTNNDMLLMLDNHIKLVDPINVLKKGYSISTIDGKIIKSTKTLKEGQMVKTRLSHGSFESIITKTEKK